MRRVYLTNESYPELREINRPFARTATWWRAIRRAAGHADFWVFVATQATVLAAFALLDAVTAGPGSPRIVHLVFGGAALAVFSYLQASWGGDMMRRHLRAVNETARFACPECGHSMVGHLAGGASPVRCPECFAEIERSLFEPPFRVPRRFRAFPPRWRGP